MSDDEAAGREPPSFRLTDLEGELLAGLAGLGPRDIQILTALLAKVRAVESELGEDQAFAMIDAVVAILKANRRRG